MLKPPPNRGYPVNERDLAASEWGHSASSGCWMHIEITSEWGISHQRRIFGHFRVGKIPTWQVDERMHSKRSKGLGTILFSQMQYIRIGLCMEFKESIDRLVLGDQILFPRLYTRLSRNYLESEDVLFEKILLNQLLYVHSEHPTMDSSVPFAIVTGAVLQPGE